MLIWDTAATDKETIQALLTGATGEVESFLRDDGKGSFHLCEHGDAPEGVREARAVTLFTGGNFGPAAGPWVFRVGVWTPEEWREEFCAWYKCEHGPILVEGPHWQGFEFLQVPAESGCQFYVLHRLTDRAALDSGERRRSRSTPWFKRLADNAWFDEPFERVLAHRISLRSSDTPGTSN